MKNTSHKEASGNVKKISLGLILNWLLGLVLAISGIMTLFSDPLVGILFLLAAAILLPPITKLTRERLKFSLTGGVKFIAVIIILVIAGLVIGSEDKDSSIPTSQNGASEQQQQEVRREAIKVSTKQLIAEFDANQLAAESKYEGQLIEFTAVIDNISEDILGAPFISLEPIGASEFYFGTTLKCSFKEKSAIISLINGQTVTLRGEVETQLFGIIGVENCKVIVN